MIPHKTVEKIYNIVVSYDPRSKGPFRYQNFIFPQKPLLISVGCGKSFSRELYQVSKMIEEEQNFKPVIHPYFFEELSLEEAEMIKSRIIEAIKETTTKQNFPLYTGHLEKDDFTKANAPNKPGWPAGKSLSEGHKKKIGDALRGKKYKHRNRTPESMKRIGNHNRSKNYILIDKRGNRRLIYNLAATCRDIDERLCPANLNSVVRGKRKHHCQWKCISANFL